MFSLSSTIRTLAFVSVSRFSIEVLLSSCGPIGSLFRSMVDRVSGYSIGPKQRGPCQCRPRAPQEFLLLRQPGYPRGTRGFPSHDCSWFGFIGNVELLLSFIPDKAISVPKMRDFFNWLISKNNLCLEIILEGQDYDVSRRKRRLFADSFVGEPSALNNLYICL